MRKDWPVKRHSQRKRGATDRPDLRSIGASSRPYREYGREKAHTWITNETESLLDYVARNLSARLGCSYWSVGSEWAVRHLSRNSSCLQGFYWHRQLIRREDRRFEQQLNHPQLVRSHCYHPAFDCLPFR